MFWDQTLIELFRKGGFAMWPLLVCSIVGFAIIVERGIYFLRLQFDYASFSSALKSELKKKKLKNAMRLCKSSSHPVAKIAEKYLLNLKEDQIRSEILKREGSLALEKVEQRLRALAALTHIAPLLGLLGTVTGLVSAFHAIELLGGQVNPGDLASGIWEALTTTVFGLVVAIPCMAAYHAFESRADQIARRMQYIVLDLDEFFGKQSEKNFKAEDFDVEPEHMGVTA